MMRHLVFFCVSFGLLSTFVGSSANAEIEYIPQSRQHQYQSFGLFFDNYSQASYRNGNRAWGAVASSFAIAGDNERQGRPQFIFYASANTSFRFRDGGGLNTETVDARVGSQINYEFNEEQRATLGWMHQSGHVSDEVPDVDLFGSNLGNEQFYFRYIRDIEKHIRIGATLRGFFDSDPGILPVAGDQFVEYVFGDIDETKFHPTPYIALGLEEYGRKKYFTTVNVQVGCYTGSHFNDPRKTNARIALGYYNGADPRLKYMQMKERETGFAYLGMFFDI